jgi:hypothetical protein
MFCKHPAGKGSKLSQSQVAPEFCQRSQASPTGILEVCSDTLQSQICEYLVAVELLDYLHTRPISASKSLKTFMFSRGTSSAP